jgi:hypothetical protein
MPEWNNVDLDGSGSIIAATSDALKNFKQSLDETLKPLDASGRQQEVIAQKSEDSLYSALNNIDELDFAGLQDRKDAYDPLNLKQANPFISDEDALKTSEYFTKRLQREKDTVIGTAMDAAADVANQTEDMDLAKRMFMDTLKENKMGGLDREEAVASFDKSNTIQADLTQRKAVRTQNITAELLKTDAGEDLDVALDKYAELKTLKGNQSVEADVAFKELTANIALRHEADKYKQNQDYLTVANRAQKALASGGDIKEIQRMVVSANLTPEYSEKILTGVTSQYENISSLTEVQKAEMIIQQDNINRELNKTVRETTAELDSWEREVYNGMGISKNIIDGMKTRIENGENIQKALSGNTQSANWFRNFFNFASNIKVGDGAIKHTGKLLSKIQAALPNASAEHQYALLQQSIYDTYGESQAWLTDVDAVNPVKATKRAEELITNYQKNKHVLNKVDGARLDLLDHADKMGNFSLMYGAAFAESRKAANAGNPNKKISRLMEKMEQQKMALPQYRNKLMEEAQIEAAVQKLRDSAKDDAPAEEPLPDPTADNSLSDPFNSLSSGTGIPQDPNDVAAIKKRLMSSGDFSNVPGDVWDRMMNPNKVYAQNYK